MKRYKISEITDMKLKDYMKLNSKELKNLVKQSRTYAISRWNAYQRAYKRRVQEIGYYPNASAYKIDSPLWNIISDKRTDLTTAQLRHQFKELKDFLSTKTSTFEGWDKTLKGFVKKFKAETGMKIEKQDYKLFWETYNRVEEYIRNETLNEKYELWRDVGEYVVSKKGQYVDVESWATDIINKIEEKTLQGEYNQLDGEENPYVYRGNKGL